MKIQLTRSIPKDNLAYGAVFEAKEHFDGTVIIQDPFTNNDIALASNLYKVIEENDPDIEAVYMFHDIAFKSLTEAQHYKGVYTILDNYYICLDSLTDEDKKELTQKLKAVFTG